MKRNEQLGIGLNQFYCVQSRDIEAILRQIVRPKVQSITPLLLSDRFNNILIWNDSDKIGLRVQ